MFYYREVTMAGNNKSYHKKFLYFLIYNCSKNVDDAEKIIGIYKYETLLIPIFGETCLILFNREEFAIYFQEH